MYEYYDYGHDYSSGGATYAYTTYNYTHTNYDDVVHPTPVHTSTSPHCELTASERTIEDGDRVTLSWDNLRTNDITLKDNFGRTLVNTKDSNTHNEDKDSIVVKPTRSTTYTLIAKNGSRQDECTVRITVDDEEEEDEDEKRSDIPRCVLTVSDTHITRGEKITLSWNNLRTDDIVIKDNQGNKVVDSKKNRNIDADKDSITLTPSRSTTFTLTATNGSRERECTVSVNVTDGVTLTSVRTQDGIPLNQVPYTGFDTSDMLAMIFYGAGGLWGSVMGYAFWMKKKAVLALAESTIA
jgi:hypothetical protein